MHGTEHEAQRRYACKARPWPALQGKHLALLELPVEGRLQAGKQLLACAQHPPWGPQFMSTIESVLPSMCNKIGVGMSAMQCLQRGLNVTLLSLLLSSSLLLLQVLVRLLQTSTGRNCGQASTWCEDYLMPVDVPLSRHSTAGRKTRVTVTQHRVSYARSD